LPASRTATPGGRWPSRCWGLALAGTWGGGVADRLQPYGADDPASASIRANERLAEATGLQPGAAVVAVVATGPVDRPADAA